MTDTTKDQDQANPWAVLITLCLGFFMVLLDTTIVNIGIPSIIDKLHASLSSILWVLNAYILVIAVLLITAGRLGDLWGPRTLYVAGLTIFTIASALCGLAQSPGQLVGARVIQGLGAAALMPQTLTMLTYVFPPERRGTAFGIWGAVAGLAAVCGPTLGGLLVTYASWRWIFYVNVPVGIVTIAMALTLIPDLRPGRRHSFDLLGVVLASTALFCFTYALIEGQHYEWGTVWRFVSIPVLFIAAAVLFMAFLLWQRRLQSGEPLIPFALFKDRNYALMCGVSTVVAFGMLGLFLTFTIYLQSVHRMSALAAGLTLVPMSLTSVFVAPVAGRLSDRFGGKYILFGGLLVFAAGLGVMVQMADVNTSRWALMPPLVLAGLGMGCTFAPMSTVAMRDVKPQLAGAASGVLNTVRQLGMVIGSSMVGALLQNRLAHTLTDEARNRSGQLQPPVRDKFVSGFGAAAKHGLEVGAGQTGYRPKLPPGTPPSLATMIKNLAAQVFEHGYVRAMHITLTLPVTVLALGALLCLAIRRESPTRPKKEAPAEAIAA
ncbi:MAG: MFS transporter [Mycobacteriales bacterium]